MILTASLCYPPHINEFELGKLCECICRRVSHDYAADLSVPISDRCRNTKERAAPHPCTVFTVHVST